MVVFCKQMAAYEMLISDWSSDVCSSDLDLDNQYVWIVLLVTVGFGLVGFGDDYLKLTKRNTKGLPGKGKLAFQIMVSAVAAWWFISITPAPLAKIGRAHV